MAIAMGRMNVLRITAVVVLVLIWTLRWQWSNLPGDFSWVKDKVPGMTGSTTEPAPAIPHTPGSVSTPPRPPHELGLPPAHTQADAYDLSDPDAPFIGWPLKRVCSEVDDWVEGVVFMCDNNFGGVGNVRNFVLTCVRYAIEAGASGLIMPAIRKRRDDDITKILGADATQFKPFKYLFDEQNFREAMAENCPQMTLYSNWTDVPNVRYKTDGSNMPEYETIDARQIDRPDTDRCDFAELDHQTDRFHDNFKAHLANREIGEAPSTTHPRLFRGNDWPGMLWEWPVWRDGPEFANTFGGLCKFNKTIMRLGKETLARMQAYARGHAGAQGESSADASKFFGVHLRTEADRQEFWPSYEDQENGYLGKAKELGLPVGYIASGDLNEAHKFANAAKEKVKMVMVSKSDLLEAKDLEELHSMSWDQQGLVDFIVLTGAEYFTGNSRSSFSMMVTKKRHLKSDGLYTRPYKVRKGGFDHNLIVGPMAQYYEHWLFIWDAMWP